MPQITAVAYGSSLLAEQADASVIKPATDEFGILHSRDEIRASVEQGTYNKVVNATYGTGIAMGIVTSFADTTPTMIIKNTSATKKIIPHYIRLICTVAGATTTSSRVALVLDTANRYSSGGTDLTANIVNAATNAGNSSIADVKFGAITATAASAKRQVCNLQIKTQAAPCWVVGDELTIKFGDAPDSTTLNGAATVNITKNVGPVVLAGSNHSLLVHMWNPANATTAPSWEVEAGWWER
jgi:hypothetical protein